MTDPQTAFMEAAKDLAAAADAKFSQGLEVTAEEMVAVALAMPERFEIAVRAKRA